MEGIISASPGVIVNEDILRAAAKTLRDTLRPVLSLRDDHNTLKQLEPYFHTLFETGLSTSISFSHRTACCNLICGSVEQCMSAQGSVVVDFVCSSYMSTSLQTLYYECYDNANEKSMKQVLSTLTLILSKNSTLKCPSPQAIGCLETLFSVLFQRRERRKAKPALQALRLFFTKDIVSPAVAADTFQSWEPQTDPETTPASELSTFQRFLAGILDWVTVPDTAASVGQVISIFLKKSTTSPNDTVDHSAALCGEPLWAAPVLLAVHKNISGIQIFRSYVLPGLFQRGCGEYWSFLQYLHIERHLELKSTGCSVNMKDHRITTESNERLLLICSLQVGKDLGLIEETNYRHSPAVNVREGVIELHDIVLGRLLNSSSTETRLSGLALLLTSRRSTKPYTPKTLSLVSQCLPNFYADSDPELRAEVQGLVQTLINRLRNILGSLKRICAKENDYLIDNENQHARYKPSGTSSSLAAYNNHTKFLLWYKRFLVGELQPAASYPRHVSALKSINALLRSGLDYNVRPLDLARQAKLDVEWPLHINIIDASMRRCLLDIQMDPFEDVRHLASAVLTLDSLPSKISSVDMSSDIPSHLQRAKKITAKSGRADHADGLARFYALESLQSFYAAQRLIGHPDHADSVQDDRVISILDEILASIEETNRIAKNRLSDAVGKHSVHGYFTALRYIFEQLFDPRMPINGDDPRLSQLIDRALQSVSDIWISVKQILCNDAPEGYMPEDASEELLSTKDVLSFAWRALKDSSLLIQCLSSTNALRAISGSPKAICGRLEYLGKLCFDQLADLRHRGAFSTVAQSFQNLCHQCANGMNPTAQFLPKFWYENVLELIRKRGSVTTRRSAGIPALVVAILASKARLPTFDSVMVDLTKIASEATPTEEDTQSELPQVHALNCLRAIFNSPKLSEKSEPYIVQTMNIGSYCLNSHIWSIRNCGLMLFRSLIDRLLGTNESWDEAVSASVFMGSKLSYPRYPGLIEFLMRHLRSANPVELPEHDSTLNAIHTKPAKLAEATFPILDLLRRAPPPESYMSETRVLLLKACGSSQWHIRDLAARTFVASVRPSEMVHTAGKILQKYPESRNHLHGLCLVLKYMAKALPSFPAESIASDIILDLYALLISAYENMMSQHASSSAQAAYLTAVNSLLQSCLLKRQNRRTMCKQIQGSDSSKTPSFFEHGVARHPHLLREAHLYDFLIYLATNKLEDLSVLRPGLSAASPLQNFLQDQESCEFVLDVFNQMLPTIPGETQIVAAELISSALQYTQHPKAIPTAEDFLLEILEELCSEDMTILNHTTTYLASLDIASRFIRVMPPQATNTALNIWGWSIRAKWQQQRISSPTDLIQESMRWLELIKLALKPSQELSFREAAVRSLRASGSTFTSAQTANAELFISMSFAIYDALNDDDEDLRALAAEVCSALLHDQPHRSGRSEGVIPLVAASELRKALLPYGNSYPLLIYQGLSRLLQQDIKLDGELKSVRSLLDETSRNEDVLFAVEKQNIYVDEIKEAMVWAQVLSQASLKMVSRDVIGHFTTWVVHGLDTLIETTKHEVDGPLGWTSKPEVFILGIRVIRAAGLLIAWRNKTAVVPARASTLLKKLHTLQLVGETRHLHELWLSTLESVLRSSVLARMKILVQSMERLPVATC